MYTPFALFINYHSTLPWWFGPLLQVAGFFLMWLSRQTAWAHPRWGRKYYLFSAIVRPLGIALISWAWVEICCTHPPEIFGHFDELRFVMIGLVVLLALMDSALQPIMVSFLIVSALTFLPRFMDFYPIDLTGDLIILLQLLLLVGFYSVWSIFSLGLRSSFLFGGMSDGLITTGPYQYQRHPQLLAALAMVFFSSFLVRISLVNYDRMITFRMVNFVMMVGLMLALIRQEEKELVARFREDYLLYMQRVPALVSWKQHRARPRLRTALLAAFLSFIVPGSYVFFGGGQPDFRSVLTLGMKTEPPITPLFNTVWRDMLHFTHADYDLSTGELPDTEFQEFKGRWRSSFFTPYPQTLFFCDQVWFDDHLPGDMEELRVKKLPFALHCDDKTVEIAQAMDYDGDGFARIDMFIIHLPNHSDNYRYLLAADDETDTFDPSVRDRLK